MFRDHGQSKWLQDNPSFIPFKMRAVVFLFFSRQFLCVVLAVLKLCRQTRLASNSRDLCPCLPRAEIKGRRYCLAFILRLSLRYPSFNSVELTQQAKPFSSFSQALFKVPYQNVLTSIQAYLQTTSISVGKTPRIYFSLM